MAQPATMHNSHIVLPEKKLLGRMFVHVDDDSDGKISPTELRRCLKRIGEEMTEEEALAMVQFADTDGDGLLGFEDFEKLLREEREEEERRLKEAFEMYVEANGDGITPRSLSKTLSMLGEKRTLEECRIMIERFDLDGNGEISFKEFDTMMR